MVIDAGSSHTTLYLYEVEVPLNGKVRQIHFIKVNGKVVSQALHYSCLGHELSWEVKLWLATGGVVC